MRVSAASFLLAFAACTAAPGLDEDAGALEGQTGALAVVSVERQQSLDPDVTATPAEVGATFARYHQIDGRSVLALVGRPSVALNRCEVDPQAPSAAVLEQPYAEVELLDAGVLEVSLGGEATRALPRTFPELGLVSGAFYAEVTSLPAARAERDEYIVSIEGSAEVPSLWAAVTAPSGFAELWAQGEAFVGTTQTWRRDQDVVVEWDAGDPQDRVELSLVSGGVELRCVADDAGRLQIPAVRLRGLPTDEDARLVVQRVRREPLDLDTFDTAWVHVATARSERIALQ